MKIKTVRGVAIFLMIEIGLVHYFSSQHEFEEAWILGYLFIADFLGALVATYGLYRQKRWGWILGLFIALGSLVSYVWSRTTGLPLLPAEEWLYPWGVTSVIAEGLFCLLAFPYLLWSKQEAEAISLPPSRNWRYLATAVGLIGLVLVNFYTYRMDTLYPELDHEHVFFLWQVQLQPEITQKTLEEQYGMQLSLAAVSAMDSIVDVRLKVLDPEKAEQLLEDEHFALLVGDTLIPAPHVSRHMFKNRTIIVMFPNRQNIVQSGTPISVVFENLRVEPILTN